MQTMTVDEFQDALKGQGVPMEHFALKCPICATVQSPQDLISAGAGNTFDEVERFAGFSCVGRWTGAGPHKKGTPSGSGCDWTLGGLFQLHELEVVTPDGKRHPRFVPASPEEARDHMNVRSQAAV
jgi:hypothetical protein